MQLMDLLYEGDTKMTALPDEIMELLVAYALNALEPDEIAQVSALLEKQPELRQLIAELRATADLLPYALPEAHPPPELRQRVLDYAVRGKQLSLRASSPPTLVRLRRLLIGSGTLAAVALIAAVIGWNGFIGTRAELARVQTELMQLQSNLATAQIAELTGQQGHGRVLRNTSGEVLLVASLPPLQAGHVYQLWLIQGKNAPISAGTFSVSSQGVGQLSVTTSAPSPGAITFAVTDELSPGSSGPTTQTLIVGLLPPSG